MFALQNRGELPGIVELEIENLVSRLRKLWLLEHNEDGTHRTTVTSSSSSGGSGSIATDALSVLGRPDNVAADAESITATIDGTVLRRSGATLGFGTIGASGLSNNGISLNKLVDIATLSVLGRSTAGVGDPEVITAGTDNQVLRRSGAALAFGAVNIASSDAITGNLPYANLPSGAGTWTGNPVFSDTIEVLGAATISGLTYPVVDGTNDQVLTTDGAGLLTWTDKAGGGGGGGITSLAGQGGANQNFANDTNVTMSSAANLHTLGWTGQLAMSRGGTAANLTAVNGGVVYSTAAALAITPAGTSGQILKSTGAAAPAWTSPAALTKTDDTNVTLTLGGSAATSLVNAASLTLGWTGQLSTPRGGTGLNGVTAGKGLYGNGNSALVTTNFKYVTPGVNTLSDAVAAMADGDALILDAGTYTQTVSVAIPTGVTKFAIVGQGQGVTILNYTTNDVDGITSSGIGVSDSNRILQCLIANFSMTYDVGLAASTAAAIQLWGWEYDASRSLGIRIQNVSITYGAINNCWLYGINLINARVAVLDQIYIRRQSNGRTGTGILLQSCMNCRIQNSFIMCVSKAFHLAKASDANIYSATKHGCEDITITNSTAYIFGYGAYLDYKCFASKIINMEFARPSSGTIYEDISSGAGNGGYHFIDNVYHDHDSNMVGAHVIFLQRPGSIIRGCCLNMVDADTSGIRDINGITIAGASATLNTVANCILRSAGGAAGSQGIWITSNNNHIFGNVFETSTGVGNDILVSGTGNLITNNMIDTTTSIGVGNTSDNNPTH